MFSCRSSFQLVQFYTVVGDCVDPAINWPTDRSDLIPTDLIRSLSVPSKQNSTANWELAVNILGDVSLSLSYLCLSLLEWQNS